MFFMHIAFSLELLVIIAAFLLFLKAKKHNANVVKVISVIIILASIASLACSAYCAIRFWEARAYFMETKMQMMDNMNQAKPMPNR